MLKLVEGCILMFKGLDFREVMLFIEGCLGMVGGKGRGWLIRIYVGMLLVIFMVIEWGLEGNL